MGKLQKNNGLENKDPLSSKKKVAEIMFRYSKATDRCIDAQICQL